ncbi:MAG: hypothetical protein AB7F09_17450 [Parvibaculaceae bacterium]
MLNRRILVLGTLLASAGSARADDKFIVIILNNGADGKVTVWVEGKNDPILPEKEMTSGQREPLTVDGTPKKLFRWQHVAADGTKKEDSGSYGNLEKEDTIRVESD